MESPPYAVAAARALRRTIGDPVDFALSPGAARQWREALDASTASGTEIALYGVGDAAARHVDHFAVPEQAGSAVCCATEPTALIGLVRSAEESGATVLCQAHVHPYARRAFLSRQDLRLLRDLVADLPAPGAEDREAWVGVNGRGGELVGLLLRDYGGERSVHAVRTRALDGGDQ